MRKIQVHGPKHQIIVSKYLIQELGRNDRFELQITEVRDNQGGEDLFARVQSSMIKLDNKFSSVQLNLFVSRHGNIIDYQMKAEIVIFAIQTFFIEYHQSAIESVYLVAENLLFQGILANFSAKH